MIMFPVAIYYLYTFHFFLYSAFTGVDYNKKSCAYLQGYVVFTSMFQTAFTSRNPMHLNTFYWHLKYFTIFLYTSYYEARNLNIVSKLGTITTRTEIHCAASQDLQG